MRDTLYFDLEELGAVIDRLEDEFIKDLSLKALADPERLEILIDFEKVIDEQIQRMTWEEKLRKLCIESKKYGDWDGHKLWFIRLSDDLLDYCFFKAKTSQIYIITDKIKKAVERVIEDERMV